MQTMMRSYNMKITDAKYMKNQNGDNVSISFTLWMENSILS